MSASPRLARLLLLLLPPLLVLGILGGLARLGLLPAPVHAPVNTLVWHGPLLISGFFGALISLERAVATGGWVAWTAPPLAGLGALILLWGPPQAGLALLSLASLGLFLGSAALAWRRREDHLAWLAAAALLWLVANLSWLAGRSPVDGLPAGIGFLVLTILAERLELSRLVPKPAWARALFAALAALYLLSTLLHLLTPALAAPLTGLALLGLTGWLLRFDIARLTVRQTGLPRFVALCLLAGYGWAALAGLGLLLTGPLVAGQGRSDAIIHALLLGFVMSMVMGHAPIVLPAVARIRVRFHRGLFGPLVVLNLSVLLRVVGGLGEILPLRRLAAVMSTVSLLMFVVMMVIAVRLSAREVVRRPA